MRRQDSYEQDLLIDPFDFLGPKRRTLLESGWTGLFRENLLGKIPLEEIRGRFHATMGRPTKEIRTMLGALILQSMFNLTDERTVRSLSFNIEWHYALNLNWEDDDSKYVCERTLREYRAHVASLEIDSLIFTSLTDTLLDKLGISTRKQRLDSTHIRSDMRRLSRIELFRKTIKKFLIVMKREHPILFKKKIHSKLVKRYLKKENGYFAKVKPSKAKKTLHEVAEDLLTLVEAFRAHCAVSKMETFGLLQRVLSEQCNVVGEAEEPKVEVKDPKEVSSDSLQNPSDPDAGYSGHKGQGYQLQIMETYQEKESDGKQNNDQVQPDLITYIDVEPACCNDSDAVEPAIDATKKRGCTPDELLADTSYGSDANVQSAAQEGVELIAPTSGKPTSKETMLILDDFDVDEDSGEITTCQVGESPCEIRRGKNDVLTIYFDPATCEECELHDICCVGLNEDHKIKYTPKQLRLSRRRVAEETDEFREKYRWRSGIEAVNAKLKRMMNIARLRVRGLAKVRLEISFKALGWNIFQAARA